MRLEDMFDVCPACRAPWRLHWVYDQEPEDAAAIARGAQLLRRRYNTCGMTRQQLESKWLDEGARVP